MYQCPHCTAPIQAGQIACAHCGLDLSPASLQRFYAWRAAPPPPAYGAPPAGYYAPAPPAPQIVYVQERKSVALAFLLTLFFGPLGMLYSTVPGALVMLLVGIPVVVLTGGLGACLIWPVAILWGCAACGA